MGVQVVDDDTPIVVPEVEVYNEEWQAMHKMRNEKKDKVLRGMSHCNSTVFTPV